VWEELSSRYPAACGGVLHSLILFQKQHTNTLFNKIYHTIKLYGMKYLAKSGHLSEFVFLIRDSSLHIPVGRLYCHFNGKKSDLLPIEIVIEIGKM
jgi:hypothetical protein